MQNQASATSTNNRQGSNRGQGSKRNSRNPKGKGPGKNGGAKRQTQDPAARAAAQLRRDADKFRASGELTDITCAALIKLWSVQLATLDGVDDDVANIRDSLPRLYAATGRKVDVRSSGFTAQRLIKQGLAVADPSGGELTLTPLGEILAQQFAAVMGVAMFARSLRPMGITPLRIYGAK